MANTISFAIPEPIVAYIDNRVVTGGYGNRSEYIRDLVRNDQREQAKLRLRELVAEGLAGPTWNLLPVVRCVFEDCIAARESPRRFAPPVSVLPAGGVANGSTATSNRCTKFPWILGTKSGDWVAHTGKRIGN